MPVRIGPRKPTRLYIAEWREARGLTQERLADRLGTTGMTISRWETGKSSVNTSVMSALAAAFDIEAEELFHHPDRPSADSLLRGQPEEVRQQAIAVIKALRRSRG